MHVCFVVTVDVSLTVNCELGNFAFCISVLFSCLTVADEVMTLVGVSALCILQCFDTGG